MTIVVLGATGGTGRHLVDQALARGFEVRALVRDPATAALPGHDRLTVVRADVHDAASVAAAVGPGDTLVSGLGPRSRSEAETLVAGARAVVAAGPKRIVWLGAAGTGASAATTSAFTRTMLKVGLGPEIDAKERADAAILDAGGVVVHVGPLLGSTDDPALTLVPVAQVRGTFWPTGAARAAVARLMLDAATGDQEGLHLVKRR
ncbi:NAD(P)H-binding protein [Actinoplanes rectilineatus]|uniref:NAD(P)H-binding protein n=1 Tax=Actinoplanes rectilineatus TaxID=113571 RepID=UPI0005F29C52|nr:NAD(P)H-binding protein [Actinoplanes rectilineatus]